MPDRSVSLRPRPILRQKAPSAARLRSCTAQTGATIAAISLSRYLQDWTAWERTSAPLREISIGPKVIASTATVRRAREQIGDA